MYLMLQHDKPEDFVLATGKTYTVREFVDRAFNEIDVEVEWKGEGIDEKGFDKKSGEILVEVDEKYFRPTEVELLIGDPSKAKELLGWEHKYDLKALVSEMVKADIKIFERDKYLLEGGHDVLDYNE